MSIVPRVRYLPGDFFCFLDWGVVAAILDLGHDVGGQVLDLGPFGSSFQDLLDHAVVMVSAELTGFSLAHSVRFQGSDQKFMERFISPAGGEFGGSW